jgi:hypothetical protein
MMIMGVSHFNIRMMVCLIYVLMGLIEHSIMAACGSAEDWDSVIFIQLVCCLDSVKICIWHVVVVV